MLDESPHWLHTIGKHAQAINVMNKMAARNKMQYRVPENRAAEDTKEINVIKTGASENICKIWVHCRLLARVVIISLGW